MDCEGCLEISTWSLQVALPRGEKARQPHPKVKDSVDSRGIAVHFSSAAVCTSNVIVLCDYKHRNQLLASRLSSSHRAPHLTLHTPMARRMNNYCFVMKCYDLGVEFSVDPTVRMLWPVKNPTPITITVHQRTYYLLLRNSAYTYTMMVMV